MQYCSIDCETTGLNPDTCQMIEFAAVLADTTQYDANTNHLPYFRCYIKHELFRGEPYALSMHPHIFKAIATGETNIPLETMEDFGNRFHMWLVRRGVKLPVFVAGKNFGSFDLQFLRRYTYPVCSPTGEIVRHESIARLFHHRNLDPTMLFFDPSKDQSLPDLKTCLGRAGYPQVVAHNALEDAQDVVRVLNYKFAEVTF